MATTKRQPEGHENWAASETRWSDLHFRTTRVGAAEAAEPPGIPASSLLPSRSGWPFSVKKRLGGVTCGTSCGWAIGIPHIVGRPFGMGVLFNNTGLPWGGRIAASFLLALSTVVAKAAYLGAYSVLRFARAGRWGCGVSAADPFLDAVCCCGAPSCFRFYVWLGPASA